MPHKHHTIDYVEITVDDIDAANAFYANAFDRALTDYGPDYVGIGGEGKEQGGLRLEAGVASGARS